MELVRVVEEIAEEHDSKPSQIAIAWVLSRGDDVVPIPGTKKRSRLTENLGAVDVQLSAEDLARLDELAPAGSTAGDRYPDMRTIDA
jgi:aryl-alcohol dehydrogenase-like predicted oxidoreductase